MNSINEFCESKTGYFIYDFERGSWWKENKNGYTKDIDEAGKYYYEDAIEILTDSNITKISSEMVHATDDKRIESIINEVGEKKKLDIYKVVEDFTKIYHHGNPIGNIEIALRDNGYYCPEQPSVALSNEESHRYTLEPENSKEGLNVSIYRRSSGNYEANIYKTDPSLSQKIEKENIKRMKKEKRKI